MTTAAWLERARANVRAAAEGREEPFRMLAKPGALIPCPECGSLCAPKGWANHRRMAHGVRGHVAQHHRRHAAAAGPAPAAPRPGRG
jgi:hypothetical protein